MSILLYLLVKRFLLYTLILLLVCWLTFIFLGSFLLHYYSESRRDEIERLAETAGMQNVDITFQSARFTGFETAVWKDVRATFFFKIEGKFLPLSAEIKTVKAEIISISPLRLRFTAENFEVIGRAHTGSENIATDFALYGKTMSCTHPFRIDALTESAHQLVKEFNLFLRGGHVRKKIDLDAKIRLVGGKKDRLVGLVARKFKDGTGLALDSKTFKPFIANDSDPYTEAEIDLIASYPFRTSALLDLKEEASRISRTAAEQDPSIPEDAYRHILWSYLLTNRYDEAFAKLVTDAHEEDGREDLFFDHEMDYLNNRLGREYARRKIAQHDLLKTLKADSRVVIRPEK